MPTLMKSDDLKLMLERIDRLRPDAQPAWGTLDAPRMLCHLSDSMRVALGEIPAAPHHTWLARTLGKFVVVHTGFEAPPGKVQTAPEMLSSRPDTWQADLDTCKELAARVGQGTASGEHPAFGRLTPTEWGKFCWKHINHHLRQFGV